METIDGLICDHGPGPAAADRTTILAAWRQRIAAGGTMVVSQDLYPNALSQLADLVLPVAGWGETMLTRFQAERRLYPHPAIMDPPGEAQPDWWILSEVARRMGYGEAVWADHATLFAAACLGTAGSQRDCSQLALQAGTTAGALGMLTALGVAGAQVPLAARGSGVLGTERLQTTRFATVSGKAIMPRFQLASAPIRPGAGEHWVLAVRANHRWQTGYDDERKPNLAKRTPGGFVEVNPEDAAGLGIESGDLVEVKARGIPTFGGEAVEHVVIAPAYVSDIVPPGVLAIPFQYQEAPVAGLAPATPDPVTGHYPYKLGRGFLRRIGESSVKGRVSFQGRNWPGATTGLTC